MAKGTTALVNFGIGNTGEKGIFRMLEGRYKKAGN
jgi:hypothetical protein